MSPFVNPVKLVVSHAPLIEIPSYYKKNLACKIILSNLINVISYKKNIFVVNLIDFLMIKKPPTGN